MTAGRGWIALALVVFATWKPWRVLAGAYLFGGVTLAQFQAQALGVDIPSQFLSMLPYRRDDRRAGDHFARRGHDPAQCPGVARASVPRRRVMPCVPGRSAATSQLLPPLGTAFATFR